MMGGMFSFDIFSVFGYRIISLNWKDAFCRIPGPCPLCLLLQLVKDSAGPLAFPYKSGEPKGLPEPDKLQNFEQSRQAKNSNYPKVWNNKQDI
jgi:hypothetical protein